jgi:hypothetical protein
MTQKKLLGYDERPLEVNGEYDYAERSYCFDPVYESQRGYIVTQAFRMCRVCGSVISSTGGPGHRSVCLQCYPAVKVADFAEGHTHVIPDRTN